MVGIRLNDTHTFYDLGFILSSYTIEAPSVKTQTVEVAGGDGVLDLTDYFGEPKFNNRKLSFELSKEQNQEDFRIEYSEILNRFNGQKVNITLDNDSDFYFVGRLSISYTRDKTITRITLECDCEPYKLMHNLTSISVEKSKTINLWNLRKKTVPEITTSHPTKITFNDYVFNLDVGVFVVPEFELLSGNNTVAIESQGITKIEYREGGL